MKRQLTEPEPSACRMPPGSVVPMRRVLHRPSLGVEDGPRIPRYNDEGCDMVLPFRTAAGGPGAGDVPSDGTAPTAGHRRLGPGPHRPRPHALTGTPSRSGGSAWGSSASSSTSASSASSASTPASGRWRPTPAPRRCTSPPATATRSWEFGVVLDAREYTVYEICRRGPLDVTERTTGQVLTPRLYPYVDDGSLARVADGVRSFYGG